VDEDALVDDVDASRERAGGLGSRALPAVALDLDDL